VPSGHLKGQTATPSPSYTVQFVNQLNLAFKMKLIATFGLLLGGAFARSIVLLDEDADNSTSKLDTRATSFWYANMDHTGTARGYAPDLDPDYSSPVFKTVNAGDGAAIQAAINSGSSGDRHGQWLASQPRVSSLWKSELDYTRLIYPTGCLHSTRNI
jgi:hypothetical protein